MLNEFKSDLFDTEVAFTLEEANGEVDGQHFLSMGYIDGEDLKSLLRRIGRLPKDKGVQIAGQNPKAPKPSWNTPIGGCDRARCGRAAVPGLEWADLGAGSRAPRCKSRGSSRPLSFQAFLLEPVVKVCLGRSVPFGNELLSRAIGQQVT